MKKALLAALCLALLTTLASCRQIYYPVGASGLTTYTSASLQ